MMSLGIYILTVLSLSHVFASPKIGDDADPGKSNQQFTMNVTLYTDRPGFSFLKGVGDLAVVLNGPLSRVIFYKPANSEILPLTKYTGQVGTTLNLDAITSATILYGNDESKGIHPLIFVHYVSISMEDSYGKVTTKYLCVSTTNIAFVFAPVKSGWPIEFTQKCGKVRP